MEKEANSLASLSKHIEEQYKVSVSVHHIEGDVYQVQTNSGQTWIARWFPASRTHEQAKEGEMLLYCDSCNNRIFQQRS